MILMGKHEPTYTPHVDTGDYVIVINADKVVFTGKKWQDKEYTWTTGYPGLRSETAERAAGPPSGADHQRGRAADAAQEQAGLQDARQAEGLRRRRSIRTRPSSPQPRECGVK